MFGLKRIRSELYLGIRIGAAVALAIALIPSFSVSKAYSAEMTPIGIDISGGTEGIDWELDYETNTLVVKTSTPLALRSETDSSCSVKVDAGEGSTAKLELQGVSLETHLTNAVKVVSGSLEIVLSDGLENTFYAESENDSFLPAVEVGDECSLCVTGDGSLTANGFEGGFNSSMQFNAGKVLSTAGIKGGEGQSTIVIKSGTVESTGFYGNAGISCLGGKITIQGGDVTARGGCGGAGIGGGQNQNSPEIEITNGEVHAYAGEEFMYGPAAIGGGEGGNGAHIHITGGQIFADASESYGGAGIGGGGNGIGQDITVKGASITTRGGQRGGAGIGGGILGSGSDINLYGSLINSEGGNLAAAIGGGNKGGANNVNIIDGWYTLSKGDDAPNYIGSGYGGSNGKVSLNGGFFGDKSRSSEDLIRDNRVYGLTPNKDRYVVDPTTSDPMFFALYGNEKKDAYPVAVYAKNPDECLSLVNEGEVNVEYDGSPLSVSDVVESACYENGAPLTVSKANCRYHSAESGENYIEGELPRNAGSYEVVVSIYPVYYDSDSCTRYLPVRKTAKVSVQPKPISVLWEGISNRIADDGITVSASLSGTIPDDDITAEVSGGDSDDPGTHTAEATLTGSDSINYFIAGESSITYEVASRTTDETSCWPIIISDITGGSVSSSAASAAPGQEVILTSKADAGHALSDLKVRDSKGNALELKNNGDSTFSFEMPSSSVTIEASFPIITFPDVDYSQWYAASVNYMADKGLMTGYSDTGLFGVGKTLTRGELATILWRNACPEEAKAYVAEEARDKTGIAGSADGKFYTAAANWAVASGAITGIVREDGTLDFAAEENVTFEQLITVLARIGAASGEIAASGADLSTFLDGANASAWSAPSLKWAVDKGLVEGYYTEAGRLLKPSEDVTRERVATVLMRAFEAGALNRNGAVHK